MTTEPRSNWGLVCKDCAPKPDPQFEAKPLDWFRGKHVKLTFPTHTKNEEYMWVLVTGPYDPPDGETEELQGTLANDPVLPSEFSCGDIIAFRRSEILTVEE